MPAISSNKEKDKKLLIRFRDTVFKKNKPLSTRMYNQLQAAPTYPTQLKSMIKWYYVNMKGGGVCDGNRELEVIQLYPKPKPPIPTKINLPTHPIASGGNGDVYECPNEPDFVYKVTKEDISSKMNNDYINAQFKMVETLNRLFRLPPKTPTPQQTSPPKLCSNVYLYTKSDKTYQPKHSLGLPGNSTSQSIQQLIYKMVKLESIKEPKRVYYDSMMRMIEQLHTTGIIHCDLKIDNFMFYDYHTAENQLRRKMIIIDFDGAIMDSTSINTKIEDMTFDFTPMFAHPYLFNCFYRKKFTKANGAELQEIENLRGYICKNVLVDHTKLNNTIFKRASTDIVLSYSADSTLLKTSNSSSSSLSKSESDDHLMNTFFYATFFDTSDDNEVLLTYLKFCDYYSLSIDFLVRIKMIVESNHTLKASYEMFEESIMTNLVNKAREMLSIRNKRTLSDDAEGINAKNINPRPQQGGSDPEPINDEYVAHLTQKNNHQITSLVAFSQQICSNPEQYETYANIPTQAEQKQISASLCVPTKP
jgi:serine/threonine protein kinase